MNIGEESNMITAKTMQKLMVAYAKTKNQPPKNAHHTKTANPDVYSRYKIIQILERWSINPVWVEKQFANADDEIGGGFLL